MTAAKIEGVAGNRQGSPKILGSPLGITPIIASITILN
jgi:hypothetical protein